MSRIDDSGRLPYDVGTVKAFSKGPGMADHHLPGAPAVPLTLRRSGRARRITLRVSRLDGRVTLTLPNGVPETEALAFAQSKEDWIRGHLDRRPQDRQVEMGALIPVEGKLRRIVPVPGRRVILDADDIGVPDGPVGPRLQSWLKLLARERLAEAADTYSARLGRPYFRLTLRDTRSRWGSCTADGALMFSWRLVMAAPRVLQYVAAHEVAHLAEMNHAPAFWRIVEQIHGPYEAQRAWLRGDGNALHHYRFDTVR